MERITARSFALFSILLLVALITGKAQGQSSSSCNSYSFPNNQRFSSCRDLPVLKSSLHWTYDNSTGTANIAFRATGVSTSSNWISWALNPNGSGMNGAQAIVAYRNSSGAISAHTTAITGYSPSLAQSTISFQANRLSAMATGQDMIIFATIKPPRTTVNQVWQVGPLSSGQPQAHDSSSSSDNVKALGSIDFLSGQTTNEGAASSSTQRKRNVHGVLNALSWGTLMPLGAIIARYMRVFKSADPAWFYLHITCQFSAYVIGVAGWATGLKIGRKLQHSHRNIGIALFCLATLQVFALLLRPKKEHKYRFYWNIYHHTIGYTVIILSIINIFKGFDILDPEKKWKRTYIGILIALAAIAVVLEAFTWTVVLKRKKDSPEKHGHMGNGTNPYSNGYGSRTQPVV